MAAKIAPQCLPAKTDLEFASKRRTVPEGKLGRMMEYQLDEKDGQWLKIGLIPEKRGFGWDKSLRIGKRPED